MRCTYTSKSAIYISASLAFVLPNAPNASATDFTAKAVMEKMQPEQRYAYVAGVVEGLAYARFSKDGQKPDGMNCIYDWFYKKPDTLDVIYAGLGQYPDYPPGAIIATLSQKSCGD